MVPHVVKAQGFLKNSWEQECATSDESWDQGWAAVAVMKHTPVTSVGVSSLWQVGNLLLPEHCKPCWVLGRDHCSEPGQHRVPQGGAAREAAALHIPGPEGQLITLALAYQLTKVPS